jgi:pilus assembly protein CpaF
VDGPGWRETRKQSARRVALITLVDRVADVIDLAPLDRAPDIDPTLKERIEAAVREQARAMRADGEVPEGLDVDVLTADAVRELVGLGPVGPALEDEDVSEVHVARADVVVVEKRGERQPLVDGLFSSEEAVARAIARLAQRSGAPLRAGEVVVERRLPSGASLFAVGPPASKAWVMTVRKRQRIEASIDDLVRAGSMSRSMADFLVGCVIARANILVVGRGAGSVSTVLSALASAAPIRERVALLHADDEIVVTGGQTVSLWDGNRIVEAERLGSSMSKLGADRVVIGSLGSVAGLAAIDAIGEGSEAILAGHAAPTLHQGLARLAARLTLARPGLSSEVAREAIAVSFDIGVEVARDPDGNLRVHRISDLSTGASSPHEASDIFLSRGDAGSVSFAATGATPTVTRAFAAQGIKLDPAIFQRSH